MVVVSKLQRRVFAELIMEEREEKQGLPILIGTETVLNGSGEWEENTEGTDPPLVPVD